MQIISNILRKYSRNTLGDPYEFRRIPEYSQLKRILRSNEHVDDLSYFLYRRYNANSEKIDIHRDTGEDLYHALENMLGSDRDASMYLNSYGIPGHRYFDGGSRNASEGTHNFVIWNTDRLKLHGIEGDKEAVDYFRNTLLRQLTGNQDETYRQVIGRKGAELIDRAIGASWLTYNLDLAQNMQASGIKPRTIKRATGWELGHEGQWKFEIPDGHLKENITLKANVPDLSANVFDEVIFGHETQPYAITTLGEIFDGNELFSAYPQLKNTSVSFIQGEDFTRNGITYPQGATSKDGSIELEGDFHFDGSNLYPNSNPNTILTLIHEVQHVIQGLEGFAPGSSANAAIENSPQVRDFDRRINALLEQLDALPDKSDPFAPMSDDEKNLLDEISRLEDAREALIHNSLNNGTAENLYLRSAGETEARNVMNRHGMTDDQRKNTLLRDTEDFRHEELLDENGETYAQSATRSEDILTPDARRQVEAVREQYQGTDKWMKAPNGKDTNLTELQWLLVRTPNFKRWFGDWEAAQIVQNVRNFLEHSEAVGSVTGNEFQKDGTPLVDRVMDFYIRTGNTVVANEELGEVILDRRGIKDSSAHGLGKEKAAAFALVPDVIRKGFIYDRQNQWKGRGYNTATLIANVKIGGKDYVCEVIVKQSENKQGFYLHEVEVKKNLNGVFRTALYDGTPSRSRLIISRYAEEAHNSSKVVDENGEPLVVWHGTNVPDIHTFLRSTKGWLGPGIYLTPYQLYANDYLRGKLGVIMPLFVNIRNPLIVKSTNPIIELLSMLYGDKAQAIFDERYKEIHDREYESFVKRLGEGKIEANIEQDFDRVIKRYILRNDELQTLLAQGNYDGIAWHDDEELQELSSKLGNDSLIYYFTEYSVQSPNQIKSATRNNGNFDTGDTDIYRQSATPTQSEYTIQNQIDATSLDEALRISQQQLDEVRRKYEGTPQWLKAPNGKQSNLTERQWLQVRTPNFIRWFGDWINDPANASKVIDENGEPLVVTHIVRGKGGFSIFNTNGDFSIDGSKTSGTGAWFADLKGNENISLDTAGIFNPTEGQNIYHVFLNIRNPFIYDAEGKRWQRVGKVWIDDKKGSPIYHNYSGKAFSNLSWAQGFIREHLDPDNNEPDRYTVKHETKFQTSDELVRAVRNGIVGNGNHDGVIIRNLRDMSVWGVDDYIAFEPNQIKSATGNNGNFSSVETDIYRQSATQAQDTNLFRKYSNILNNSNPDNINPDNLSTDNDGFMTQADIERYSQVDTYHGTGHVLRDNRFDLSKVGTGEGGQFRGWGIYSAQARRVSETYRLFGLEGSKDVWKLHVRLNDGTLIYSDKRYDIDDSRHWQGYDLGNPDEIGDDDYRYWLARVLDDLEQATLDEAEEAELNGEDLKDFPEIINESGLIGTIEAQYKRELLRKKTDLERGNYGQGYEMFRKLDEDYVNHTYPMLMEALHSIKSVTAIARGNIYNSAVSDNDYRLNWDASLQEQSEHVKKAIDKIRSFIHRWSKIAGFDTSAFDNAKTGGDLYTSIANIMDIYLRGHSPKDGITGHKKRTSLLFNRFGVPGLYFLDRFSRRGQQNPTYNYVTWNEDAIHVTGIEPDSDQAAIDYFETYKREHPDGFISPDTIDTFNQLALHGTGNIIWNNRFDLRFVGSSEGTAAFGFGAYFAENIDVPQSYRRNGLPNYGLGIMTISFRDGRELLLHDVKNTWEARDKSNPSIYSHILTEMSKFAPGKGFTRDNDKDFKKAKQRLKDMFQAEIQRLKGQRNPEKRAYYRDLLRQLRQIKDVTFSNPMEGNIYQFDIPENDELLDWDALIDEQPEIVRKNIRRLLNSLERKGFSSDEILSNPDGGDVFDDDYDTSRITGQTLYWGIVRAFRHMDRLGDDMYGLKRKGITRTDARASWLLNKFGIPGHRFLDRGSRDSGYGTHNFVIWNTDKISMTGIDPSSDELARKTFYNGGQRQLQLFGNNDETYRQSATDTSTNIRTAESFLTPEAKRQVDTLRAKYQGFQQWMKAPNGKASNLDELQWLLVRTDNFKRWFGDWELDPANASKIVDENGEPLVVYHGTPNGNFSVFNTEGKGKTKDTGAWFSSSRTIAEGYGSAKYPEGLLFPVFLNIRYPYIYDANGRFWKNVNSVSVVNRQSGEAITANQHGSRFWSREDARNYIRNTLNDASFQHWNVQVDKMTTDNLVKAVREGKLGNGNYDGVVIRNVVDVGHGDNIAADDFIIFMPAQAKSSDRNNGQFSESLDIFKQSSDLDDIKQTRADWDIQKRKQTLPTLSEDTPRSKQILNRSNNGNSNFLTPEKFQQLMHHGTRHILSGNGFDLRYIGVGEGAQAFGYGIYLGEAYGVGENYRMAGLQDIERSDTVITDKNGYSYSFIDFWDYIEKQMNDVDWHNKNNALHFAEHIRDFAHGKYSSIEEAVNAFIFAKEYSIKEHRFMSPKDEDIALNKRIAEMFTPKSAKAQTPYKGNHYLVDGPENDVLLDWDAPMSKQPKKVLNALKNAGLFINDNETGQQLYRRLQEFYGGGDNGEFLASMKLNEAGIPGHRFLDSDSRANGQGTHNFVIWNTDTLRLLGLTEDSEQDAQDYYRAEDYSRAYLDSLDNDSDIQEYTSADWQRELDDFASASLDAREDDGFNDTFRQNATDNFLTQEKFEQLVYHGTDNTILGNMFDLKFVGSSEGNAMFGYGAYFAENPAVSEGYRHFGDPDYYKFPLITVSTADGKTYSDYAKSILFGHSSKTLEERAIWDFMFQVYYSNSTEIEHVRKELLKYYRASIKRSKGVISNVEEYLRAGITSSGRRFKKNGATEKSFRNTITRQQKDIKTKQALISIVKSLHVTDISIVESSKKGNLYVFDIPENDVLMDWHAPMSQQPDNVRAARKSILKELKDAGLDVSKLQRARTGEEFYWALTDALAEYEIEGIERADARASFMLNKHGVPGHHYWDRGSRGAGAGTRNFVIWNTQAIKMLGVEGNPEAVEHFRNTALQKLTGNPDETYKQSATNSGRKNNNATRSADSFLTPEAKTQVDAIRAKYRGTSQWLKAPNGEDTNLNELQWLLVRTNNFKAWFGDWENEPQNSSQAVDANGEPLVLYFGAHNDYYTVLDPRKSFLGQALFTSNRFDVSETYTREDGERRRHSKVYPLFLNLRNPYIIDAKGKSSVQLGDIWLHDNETGQDIYRKKDDEPYFGKTFNDEEDAADYIDDELDGDFDRYYIEASKYQVTDDYVEGVYNGDFDSQNDKNIPFDGIIFRNIRDAATDDIGDDTGDVFVFFDKHQAKSSDRNNGEFSSNPEIYKQGSRNTQQDFYGIDAEGRQLLLRFNPPEIDAVLQKYKGTGKLFKAPNGKKSNLDNRSWLLVRTQNFKAWFGDWENDPANASKVLDEKW